MKFEYFLEWSVLMWDTQRQMLGLIAPPVRRYRRLETSGTQWTWLCTIREQHPLWQVEKGVEGDIAHQASSSARGWLCKSMASHCASIQYVTQRISGTGVSWVHTKVCSVYGSILCPTLRPLANVPSMPSHRRFLFATATSTSFEGAILQVSRARSRTVKKCLKC